MGGPLLIVVALAVLAVVAAALVALRSQPVIDARYDRRYRAALRSLFSASDDGRDAVAALGADGRSYVPPAVRHRRDGEGGGDPAIAERSAPPTADVWALLRQPPAAHSRLVVLAGPGFGKSALVRQVVLELAGRHGGPTSWSGRRPLPIPVRLPERQDAIVAAVVIAGGGTVAGADGGRDGGGIGEDEPVETWVLARLAERALPLPPPGWFERRLSQGRCLVVVDGLDEVAGPGSRTAAVLRWLDGLGEAWPRCRVVLAARPDDVLGGSTSGATTVELLPFDASRMAAFTAAGSHAPVDGEAAAFLDDLAQVPALHRLGQNPLFLGLLLELEAPPAALPTGRSDLLGRAVATAVDRARPAGVPPRTTLVALRHLAWVMTDAALVDLPVEVAAGQVRAVLAAATEDADEDADEDGDEAADEDADEDADDGADGAADAELAELSEGGPVDGRWFVAEVAATTGVLHVDGDRCRFSHALVQARLAAELAATADRADDLVLHLDEPWWREAIVLAAGVGLGPTLVAACLAETDEAPPSAGRLALAVRLLDETPDGATDAEASAHFDDVLARLLAEPVGRLVAHTALEDDRADAANEQQLLSAEQGTLIDWDLVTNAEYQLFLADVGARVAAALPPDHRPQPGYPRGRGRSAVAGVRPAAAIAFCAWLDDQVGRDGGWRHRLPSPFEAAQVAGAGPVGFWVHDEAAPVGARHHLAGAEPPPVSPEALLPSFLALLDPSPSEASAEAPPGLDGLPLAGDVAARAAALDPGGHRTEAARHKVLDLLDEALAAAATLPLVLRAPLHQLGRQADQHRASRSRAQAALGAVADAADAARNEHTDALAALAASRDAERLEPAARLEQQRDELAATEWHGDEQLRKLRDSPLPEVEVTETKVRGDWRDVRRDLMDVDSAIAKAEQGLRSNEEELRRRERHRPELSWEEHPRQRRQLEDDITAGERGVAEMTAHLEALRGEKARFVALRAETEHQIRRDLAAAVKEVQTRIAATEGELGAIERRVADERRRLDAHAARQLALLQTDLRDRAEEVERHEREVEEADQRVAGWLGLPGQLRSQLERARGVADGLPGGPPGDEDRATRARRLVTLVDLLGGLDEWLDGWITAAGTQGLGEVGPLGRNRGLAAEARAEALGVVRTITIRQRFLTALRAAVPDHVDLDDIPTDIDALRAVDPPLARAVDLVLGWTSDGGRASPPGPDQLRTPVAGLGVGPAAAARLRASQRVLVAAAARLLAEESAERGQVAASLLRYAAMVQLVERRRAGDERAVEGIRVVKVAVGS